MEGAGWGIARPLRDMWPARSGESHGRKILSYFVPLVLKGYVGES